MLQVKGPKESLSSDLLRALGRHQSELRQLLGATCLGSDTSLAVPLSNAQEEIWAVERARPHSARFGLTSCVLLHGKLDTGIVGEVVNALMERHVALRTGFSEAHGCALQHVRSYRPIAVSVERGIGHMPESPCTLMRHIAAEQARRAFDLSAGPLLDVNLCALGDEHTLVTLRRHHIVNDGTSFAIIVDEFCSGYQALHGGKALPERAGGLGYPAFVAYERATIATLGRAALRDWWRMEMCRAKDIAAMSGRPSLERASLGSGPGTMRSFEFTMPAPLIAGLQALSRRCGETLYSTMFALFRLLLEAKQSPGAECIGLDASIRDAAEFEGTIGLFVNRLPIVHGVEPSSTFMTMVTQVGRTLRGALAHKWLAHHEIDAQATAVGLSGLSYLFGFHNNTHAAFSLPGCSVVANHVHIEQEQDLPFVCYMSDAGSVFRVSVAYRVLPHTEVLASEFDVLYLQLAQLAVDTPGACCSEFIRVLQARDQQLSTGHRAAFARMKQKRFARTSGSGSDA
ncbi:condensation domain-containing protein [Pseudomonas mosselii]|uniref:condensation domain-containing protein n=1 Tax=Pseudomonas mosselii TaxID=78327 RepID=UPI0011B4F67F|nr:condensation domain-containing protein [Pseudomonas mosselii]